MQLTASPLPAYPAYSVNTHGEVFRNGIPVSVRKNPGRSLKLRFRHKGKQVELGIAKLVAQLFIPNPSNHNFLIFKDGNHHNCHADNIEWVSNRQYARYSWQKNLPLKPQEKQKQTIPNKCIPPCPHPGAKPLPAFNGYFITSCGKIYKGARLLKPYNHKTRALQLRLRYRGRVYHLGLAKLVATLFIPNPHHHPRTIFLDGNNKNCMASNLEWVSESAYRDYQFYGNPKPSSPAEEELRKTATPVPGFPGYSVTPDGKIFSPSRLLNGIQSHGKAPRVKMKNADCQTIRLAISTIVALTFIPNPHNHPKTIFKDRDKSNCRVENIEWVSLSEFTRFTHSQAESWEVLGPPRHRKTRTPDWIDPDRVPLEGFPNYYISPKGIVYKKDRIIKPVMKKGRSLKIRIHPSGWPRDKHLTFGLAKLVAEHFIPNPRRHKHIIFKDRNNQNCSVENIAWVDGETFAYYSGISVGAKKKVVDRKEAIRTCEDQYLREYYKTLDETWLHYCWEEIEKQITMHLWPEFRTDCYMYFIDRAKRFSILRSPIGLMYKYMKGLKVKLRKEISPDMSLTLVRKTDESLRFLRSSKSSESNYDNW